MSAWEETRGGEEGREESGREWHLILQSSDLLLWEPGEQVRMDCQVEWSQRLQCF